MSRCRRTTQPVENVRHQTTTLRRPNHNLTIGSNTLGLGGTTPLPFMSGCMIISHLHQPIEGLLDAVPGDGRFDLLPDRPLRAAIAGRGGAFLRHAVSRLRFHLHVERFVGAELDGTLPVPPTAGCTFLLGYPIGCCCHFRFIFFALKLQSLYRRRSENVTAESEKRCRGGCVLAAIAECDFI